MEGLLSMGCLVLAYIGSKARVLNLGNYLDCKEWMDCFAFGPFCILFTPLAKKIKNNLPFRNFQEGGRGGTKLTHGRTDGQMQGQIDKKLENIVSTVGHQSLDHMQLARQLEMKKKNNK